MSRFFIKTLAGLAVVLALAGQASAEIVLYNNFAAYQAQTTGLTTVDFNGIAAPGSFVSYGNGPLVLSGVTFVSNGSMFVIDPGFYGSPYAGGGFLNSDYSSPTNVITATLPGGYTALGMDFGALFGGGTVDFHFTLSDGSVFDVSSSTSIGDGTLDFVGVTSTIAITSVTMSMPDAPLYNAVDNFNFGTALPEPASITSAGIAGFIGLLSLYRRRRKSTIA